MSMIDCKGMIVSLLERIDSVREEKVSAGTKYRLMGLVADVAEVAQALQEKVFTRVSQEVVLDSKGRKWQRIKLSSITQLLS